jgi:hypothetical protein
MTGAIRPAADVTHGESAAEERVRGVGYLDLIEIRISRVVEEGILLASRSIRSITATCGTFSSVGCGMGCCCD